MTLIAAMRAALRSRQADAAIIGRDRMIIESAIDDAILTCGLDGRVTTWNTGAQAILGHAPEDILGQPYARIYMADDVDTDVPGVDMRAARDGTPVWSSGRTLALRDRRGQLAGYLTILHDQWAARHRDDPGRPGSSV